MSKYEHRDFRSERVVRKFLFWPKTLDRETRWFVLTKVKQELISICHVEDHIAELILGLDGFKFVDVSWADREAPINQIVKHERGIKIEEKC